MTGDEWLLAFLVVFAAYLAAELFRDRRRAQLERRRQKGERIAESNGSIGGPANTNPDGVESGRPSARRPNRQEKRR